MTENSKEINNFYNFRNSVRHFMNLENICPPYDLDSMKINDLAWTEPINFRLKKQENKYRTIKMPNILNFLRSYEYFKSSENFLTPNMLDETKRLVPNLETGDFKAGIYDEQLEDDFNKLCIYDNLLKLDIKSYYGRIYTHSFNLCRNEPYLTNLNLGATNGIIMGNYISLYFAEKYSTELSIKIKSRIEIAKINCKFSYFSDDFYFFCNTEDNMRIISIFDSVLEEYDLERNDEKLEEWTYLTYNTHNIVEKYWKKIISESRNRYDKEKDNNKFYFINQLIYRMSNLKTDKLKETFLNVFFKTTYFQEIKFENYVIEDYNYHQLCYIFKFSPETMIYSINNFRRCQNFSKSKFTEFLEAEYTKVLHKPYHENQLYYYFTIKTLDFKYILEKTSNIVADSKNQLLISFYLKDKLFDFNEISKLKLKIEERYWFQNYHLILYSDLIENLELNIVKYLIPKYCIPEGCNTPKKCYSTYKDFYNENLESGVSLVSNIESITSNINDYMNVKIAERNELNEYEEGEEYYNELDEEEIYEEF